MLKWIKNINILKCITIITSLISIAIGIGLNHLTIPKSRLIFIISEFLTEWRHFSNWFKKLWIYYIFLMDFCCARVWIIDNLTSISNRSSTFKVQSLILKQGRIKIMRWIKKVCKDLMCVAEGAFGVLLLTVEETE